MPLKIKVLSDQLANQIAAGEVVDRPASVIKELIENAVDAQATQIEIDTRGAGKSYMMVKDNGCGMGKEDLFTAFERHATSKIKNEEDLASIQTLGFRGEALPSIASVAKVKMESRDGSDDSLGGALKIEGGKVLSFTEIPLPKGTRVEISHLFFNVPARRKFLKTDNTEQTHITNTVIQQILVNVGVGFLYTINGKVFVKVAPEADFAERIRLLFGNSIFEKLVPVDFKYGETSVKGHILHPNFSPSHNNYQFSFLNGRYIKDKVIFHGVATALKRVMSSEKKPAYFLKIEVPFDSVDVNVHPSKYEVRFVASQQVHFILEQAIKLSLDSSNVQAPPPQIEAEKDAFQGFQRRESSFTPSADTNDVLAKGHIRNWEAMQRGVENQAAKQNFEPLYSSGTSNFKRNGFSSDFGSLVDETPVRTEITRHEGGFTSVSPSISFSGLNYIGQWQRSFLLFDTKEGIVIVDQHTAHERVKKERLVVQYDKGKIEVSNLLMPVKVEVPLPIVESVEKYTNDLARLGFDITRGGNNVFFIRSVPALLAEEQPEKLFDDLVASLAEENKETKFVDLIDPLIDRLACHSAVRAHKELSSSEVSLLCKELDELEVKISCPHGRPIALLIRSNDIFKTFFRT